MPEEREKDDTVADVLFDPSVSTDVSVVDLTKPENQLMVDGAIRAGGFVRRCTRDFWERYEAHLAAAAELQREFDAFPVFVSKHQVHLSVGETDVCVTSLGRDTSARQTTPLPLLASPLPVAR